MSIPVRRFFSTTLGVLAGLATLVVALAYVFRWTQAEALQAPPVSQVGFFYSVAFLAALGAVGITLALRSGTDTRAAGMMLLGSTLLVHSALRSGALDEIGAWLFYVGLVSLVGAGFALTEARRRWIAAITGLIGWIPLLAIFYASASIVSDRFP